MKTTVEIPDALLKDAKEVAAARGTTLKELIATGLHAVVHDARIAALCLYHGVRVLWSADRDFSRFPGLAVTNPLTVD